MVVKKYSIVIKVVETGVIFDIKYCWCPRCFKEGTKDIEEFLSNHGKNSHRLKCNMIVSHLIDIGLIKRDWRIA